MLLSKRLAGDIYVLVKAHLIGPLRDLYRLTGRRGKKRKGAVKRRAEHAGGEEESGDLATLSLSQEFFHSFTIGSV
ncbi:hypothetical protein SRHO_G00196660 [Serrasalmus rhombeus]